MALAIGVALMTPAFSPFAEAGPGTVCMDGVSPVGPAPAGCANPIGTYYANSPQLRKFVDSLPGLTPAGASSFASGNLAGEYISLAVADPNAYGGANYFVIAVVEHQQWMHSDLQKPTTLRSYVQIYPQGYAGAKATTAIALKYPNGSPILWPGTTEQVWAYDKPHYLGPIILTTTGTPVRVKMVNFLPKERATLDGAGKVLARNGDMFLPVDETLPGAGKTPAQDKFPQNRVAFHLHGGDSPWISDGTPHQWIAATGDSTPYKHGDRLANVPDMPDPGDGSQTIFWPNDQSMRLMWYHDHTFGLTRQNAYAGAAAGYVIMDAAEDALLNGGTLKGVTINKAIPGTLLEQIVLVIQDKTFVPNDIAVQDSKWDVNAWGKPGDLWYPHVYEPAQLWNTAGTSAASNPAGRWDYAFDSVTLGHLPTSLPLPDGSYGNVSTTPESYMDTPLVNGVAYPVLKVEPRAYRVRFLNGANDRYFNLSLWVADANAISSDGRTHTEISTVAGDGRPGGVPDPATAGPNIVQFANEAGLLPLPVVHTPAPMNLDAGGVETGGDFYLGGAERADTVIDFSQYAGKTLILYNDSSAPVPAGDPRYDYYTGNPDQTSSGGAPSTLPGFGPNTRTVMQIVVANNAPAAAYDPAGNGGLMATELPKAYAASVDAHIVPAMDVATQLQVNMTARTMSYPDATGARVTVPLKVKTIEGFNEPIFGRLMAQIGVELPNAASVATPLAYIDPANDIIHAGDTQFWMIKNNDGDNHPMHVHLFNVQVVARVTQTVPPTFKAPEPDEAGWKETFKNWPGEDLIIALRPKTPQLPFGLPNSVRLLDPTLIQNATTNTAIFTATSFGAPPLAFVQVDLDDNSPTFGSHKAVANNAADFGWEYVWHCHILGHEEFDLMRPLVFHPNITASMAPGNVTVSATGKVVWTDPTPATAVGTKGDPANEIGFRVERAELINGVAGTFAPVAATGKFIVGAVNTLANATSFQDSPRVYTDYQYRVVALNQVGETTSLNVANLAQPPAPPAAVTATPSAASKSIINLAWTDMATNETGYVVMRATGTINPTTRAITWGAGANVPTATSVLAPNLQVFTDGPKGVATNTLYRYQILAMNGATPGPSSEVITATATTLGTPGALEPLLAPTKTSLSLKWVNTSTALVTNYEVQHCVGAAAVCAVAPAAAWQPVPGDMVIGTGKAQFIARGLVTKTTYSFRVRSVNAAVPTLLSPWSSVYGMKTI